MSFQKNVLADIAWGIVGELALGLPQNVRAEPIQIKTAVNGAAGQAPIYGRAVTGVAGDSGVGEVGGTGTYLGILFNPKENVAYAALGADTYGIEAGSRLQIVSDAPGLFVQLSTAGNIGDGVAYKSDGTLAAAPLQVAPASTTLIPGARVVRYNVLTGVAIISLTQLPAPAVAP
ncbi:structural protein [Yersinia phage vB_YenM_P744]